MIFHVLDANATHHIPEMVKNILKYSNQTNTGGEGEHFFLLKQNPSKMNLDLTSHYLNLFGNDLKHKGYALIYSNLDFALQLMKVSKKNIVVLHSIPSIYNRPVLFWIFLYYFLTKNQKRNIALILWGVPMSVEDKKKGLLRNCLFKTQCMAMNRLGYVVVLSMDDFQKVKQFYSLEKNIIQASYINEDFIKFRSNNSKKAGYSNPRIMVAHSAFPHNKHIETFNCLKIFNSNSFDLICPLSYGKDDYKYQVKGEGIKIFGDKFIPLYKLLPRDEYHDLLSSLNVYISHAEMQTGLYVIYFCVSIGVKLYLNQNNYNWMCHLGFKVNHVDEINGISYDEFLRPLPLDWVEYNVDLAKRIFSVEERVKKWKEIYSKDDKFK